MWAETLLRAKHQKVEFITELITNAEVCEIMQSLFKVFVRLTQRIQNTGKSHSSFYLNGSTWVYSKHQRFLRIKPGAHILKYFSFDTYLIQNFVFFIFNLVLKRSDEIEWFIIKANMIAVKIQGIRNENKNKKALSLKNFAPQSAKRQSQIFLLVLM